ncbi:DNA-directed RNA polymerase I and III subunit RPAC1 [Histomonas meleagridis]|uniref:DNA-directed RNA polymerase I and III subunit RPAC1 n=1 Tax=Histomonas meleagridis TaxID=135588 RepID=UPI00355A95A2|nr:DNA-directed RNA polymerase I and III subunit RPAC1 [Histomonas meleagridis]KAH0800824.1 DNA-directed RNA polymerase I and III subunit RPAC1 [Histomonas meleagridis]
MDFSEPTIQDNEIHDPIPETRVELLYYERFENTKEDRVVFDLINAPASHANALRRTLLATVPSMAFDFIEVYQNASVLPDEVICHRIGLIPININPKYFEYIQGDANIDTIDDPKTTLLFGLCVIGGEGPDPNLEGVDATWDKLPPFYTGPSGCVMSSHFVWMPYPDQREILPVFPTMLHDNIEITRLHPGQKIELYARAIKGSGSRHAKFSPVSTAFYRLVPKIEVRNDISDEKKQLIVNCCPRHVFEIEESGNVIAADVRKCTFCKECTRLKRLNGCVRLEKEPNHYEFTVESFGVRSAPSIVKEALQILNQKSMNMKAALEDAVSQ